MTTRSIGIDFDGANLRIVVLQTEKGRERLLHTASFPWDGVAPLAPLFAGRAGVIPAVGDRVATALAAATGFTRTLTFPFSERRKIEAAIPLELANLLPIPLDDCVVAHQEPFPVESGVSVVAAAVPAEAVARVVAPFDSAGLPLQIVDLFPFALAAGLADELGDGLALCLTRGQGTILLLAAGRLRDYRVIPLPEGLDAEARATQLLRELAPLLRTARSSSLRLFGPGVDAELLVPLQRALPEFILLPALTVDGVEVSGEFLPALALARRGLQAKGGGLNFRRGAFSRHGESAALRSRLLTLAAIATLALLVFAVSAGLRWWTKRAAAEARKEELTTIYRQAIPGTGTIVDPVMQMRAHLAELGRASRPGGQHPLLSPRAIMREISTRMPTDMAVNFREWNIEPGEIRIEAVAPSFDAANRIAAALSASPLFKSVQVTDARSGAEANKVDFRLTLICRPPEELP